MRKLTTALAVALSLWLGSFAPLMAAQNTLVMPVTGPHTMAEVMADVNAAFQSVGTNYSGATAPAVCTGSAACTYQLWVDTSASPRVLRIYDGTSWVAVGSLDTSAHTFTPAGGGGGTGTVNSGTSGQLAYYASTAAAVSGNANVTISGGDLTLGVASSAVGTASFGNATSGTIKLTPPTGALGSSVLTFPIATDTLIGKATTDTLTNKTFDTAGTGNSFSINGVAATANTGTGAVARAAAPTFTAPTLGVASATTINKVTITAPASGSTLTIPDGVTMTGPATSDTVVGKATTDTLTNKTFDTAGSGNTFSINGVAATANTGTGAVARAAGPTFTTPTLGVASATSINKMAITAPATGSTLAVADGKTLTANSTLTTAGTDGKTLTVSNSGTLAGGDAFTLAIAASKTLTVSNSLTLAGTDSTTMTFPSTSSTIPKVVVSGAKALATGAIGSAACTSAQTDTATGTLTTDAIIVSFNGDPTGVTGYVPLTSGMLAIIYYPTADTVNFKVCNNTSSSITPGAVTINWRVLR